MIREVMRVVQKQLKTTLFIERYGIVDTEIERIAVLCKVSISLYLRFIIDIVAGKEHIPPVEHTKIIWQVYSKLTVVVYILVCAVCGVVIIHIHHLSVGIIFSLVIDGCRQIVSENIVQFHIVCIRRFQ